MDNNFIGKKIILFGTGVFYQKFKEFALKKSDVIALADNDKAKQGSVIDGVTVIAPNDIVGHNYDYVALFLKYESAAQVRRQLVSFGVDDGKILFYDEYIAGVCRGEYKVYEPERKLHVAIVTVELNYNGGTIAIVSAARALAAHGFSVTVVAPGADTRLSNELTGFGIEVVVYPAFYNMCENEIDWIKRFDFVIVNVLQKIDSAIKIFGQVPMFWWLHECSEKACSIYTNTFSRYLQYLKDPRVRKIPTFAVSQVARRAFLEHFPNCDVGILHYCVHDEAGRVALLVRDKNRPVTFALIAGFSERKQQVLFLEVAARLEREMPGKCRFLLIGNAGTSDYAKKVSAMAAQIPSVELCGVFTRAQMRDAYADQIDVVVCPSLEETMSLTITEGMMWSKLCICSDNTGMSEYITDGENGFICKTGDLDSLYEKMRCCAENFDALDSVRQNARRTYEENFTMDVFAERLEKLLNKYMK